MTKGRHSGRLTVILHADVADSTGLVQRDELLAHDGFQLAFHCFEDVIKKYGGSVLELRGDAVIAVFDRASDAVSSALAFQQFNSTHAAASYDSLKPALRIGVAMGEVVIADNTVTGAGVVLAQRVEQLADPGGICITSAIHEALPRRMPFGFDNLGDQDLKGFEDAVRVFKVGLRSGETIPGPQASSSPGLRITWPTAVVSIIIVLGFMAVLAYYLQINSLQQEQVAPYSAEKPVVAVLPFENMSGDPQQDYFSNGITEDIITDLSQLNGLAVIARNSSFNFGNTTATVQEISEKLGAQYLLQGSIRKDGNNIRINAQLVNADSGQQMWASRYDRELTDIFAIQDEITGKVVSELSVQLTGNERRQLAQKSTNNFDAYDLFLQGQIAGATFSKEGLSEAANLYRRAIELDARFARAYGALAIQLTRQVLFSYTDNPAQTRERSLELALKGASMNPDSPQVQWALGYVYLYREEFDNAIAALERAISLSPSYADGYAMLALIRNNLGQAEEAIRLLQKGMELNPFYSWDYLYNLGRAHYTLGNYQLAADFLEQALQRNPSPRGTRLFLIATYVQLGRQDDAEWEVIQLEMSSPETTLSQLRQVYVIKDDELFGRLLGDLEDAGLAE
jgi:adenylate cyclase